MFGEAYEDDRQTRPRERYAPASVTVVTVVTVSSRVCILS
jgi:hypothetical protein